VPILFKDGKNNFMFLEFIYEDEDFIAVNKPAGVAVHPDGTYKNGTLVQEIIKKYPEIKNVGDDLVNRPGIVHRIDKDTSGILLVAKTQKAFYFFKEAFQKRKIKKTYVVLVLEKLGKRIGEKGVVDLAIARSAKTPILRTARGKTRGKLKDAVTEYEVMRYFNDFGKDFTLLKAYPKTGRTHQIRAHFKAIGHSVVCDKLYGGRKFICPGNLKRQFLHAYSLEFKDMKGARLILEAELPEDLQSVLEKLRNSD
jgi:23S rRNA pseudouridine1911/1915/1917 synthase